MSERVKSVERRLAGAQAAYFITTGLWSIAHRRSFEAVSGPKVDYWLVQTVGALVTAVGASLALASARGRVAPELRLLAGLSALGLAAVEVAYVSAGRISRVYLADAAIEVALAAGWARTRDRRSG